MSGEISRGVRFLLGCVFLLAIVISRAHAGAIGKPGSYAVYEYRPGGAVPTSVVQRLVVTLGDVAVTEGCEYQWYRLEARKADGRQFRVWLLTDGFPSPKLAEAQRTTSHYLLQEGKLEPLEYTNKFTGQALLPAVGFWQCLLPRAVDEREAGTIFPSRVKLLGLPMDRLETGSTQSFAPPEAIRLELPCDLQIGTRYGIREKDKTRRRFDGKEVESGGYMRFEREDYPERFAAGETTFTLPVENEDLVVRRNVFYLGIDGATAFISYPESLYRSNFLGVHPDYLDEPGAVAAQRRVKPRVIKDPALGNRITPQYMLEEFKKVFHSFNYENRPLQLIKGLNAREDVDTGDMPVRQSGMFTWEVPISTGAYQLSDDLDGSPNAIVYQSRMCTDRDLPFLDSIAGIQIPTNDHKALLDMHFAALRGAARTTGKKWGISLYRRHQVGEVPGFLKNAYDAGSSYFFFWTGEIPYRDMLAYSRYIRDYAEAHPDRDMAALKRAGEVMILFPPGYTFLQFSLGRKESMWWIAPLNLERKNRFGLKYRQIIRNIGMEVERCYRLGVCYDMAWDIEGLDLSGYREVVRVKEDGTIEVTGKDGAVTVLQSSRPVTRPAGDPPGLEVTLSTAKGQAPLEVTAMAELTAGSAPVYFTPSLKYADAGVWRNEKVIWQLYGPEEWDYNKLEDAPVTLQGATCAITFTLDKPGAYRLRASVVDRAGRSTVVWRELSVE